MDAQRWRQIEEIYHSALNQPAEGRVAFVSDACRGDADLMQRVQSLLVADDQAGSFLEIPALEAASTLERAAALGQQIGSYQILHRLGAGGMGEVFRAHDNKLGRDVAIKTLPREFADDPQRASRLRREARTLASLNHPNIAAIYDLVEADSVNWLVLELVEGETLCGPLPIEKALDYAGQIAEALEAAHNKGIVHRDLKPANVKVTPEGRVKVLDFGLAKAIWGSDDRERLSQVTALAGSGTLEGQILGTPPYMSPEQARGESIDKRTDIWAFGCLLYELLTGKRAFKGETTPDTVAAVLEREPEWGALPAKTPAKIRELLRRCLQKDPSRRPQEIGAARRVIDEVTASVHGIKRWQKIATMLPVIVGIVIALLIWTRVHGPAVRSLDSIAVLPFQNLSPNSEGDYLADGVTEELIANLAQIRALKVISRTSVMQYKKTQKSLPQIGRELDAAAVIEGSVIQAGQRVRVTAQLIDARTDRHLWAQSYDRDLRDVLPLLDEIARMVADEVRVQLLPGEKARLMRARQIDPRAHELYVRARYDWNSRTPEGLQRSVDLLNQAIVIEPAWALAYAALADSYNVMADNGRVAPEVGFPNGENAAHKALELDPDLGQAHAALAFDLWQYDRERSAADAEFRRALQLQPSYGEAHYFYALYLVAFRKDAEGLAEIRKALELDPLSPRFNTNYADILRMTGHEAEAIVKLQKCVAADPIGARWALLRAYVHLNKPAEAMKTADEAAAAKHPSAKFLQALALASLRHQEALPFIRDVEREFRQGNIIGPPRAVALAAAYLVAGDRESAWKWFERAGQLGGPFLALLRDPLFDPLRRDPRYPALLEKLRLR